MTSGGATPHRRAALAVWGLVAALTALRLLYLATGPLDLSPDEAHYWEWSRRLDLSYYSKGPLVAYLIRLCTSLFGESALAIRAGALALSLVGAWALYRLGREAFGGPGPALLAVAGLQLTPLVWAGSLLMTIDPPFLVLWTLTLLLLQRALAGSSAAWVLGGAAVGLGLLAKYSMLYVVPGLLLYFWWAPEARRWLRHPAPWAGAAVALALFSPVVLWNVRQGWVSARHVASQGRGAGGLTLAHVVEFAGSQLLVLTPVVAAILAWGAWLALREGARRGREPYRFLVAFAAPVLAVHLLAGLQGKIQANWTAAAYPPLALAAAGLLLERRRVLDDVGRGRQRALLVVAAAVALTLSGAGHFTGALGVPPRLDPTTRLRGWRELGEAVSAIRRQMPVPERTFLVSDRYQVASELAFYVAGRPTTYNFNLGRRLNQYDFWEGPEARLGWDAVFVQEGVRPLDPRLREAFERLDPPVAVEVRRGGTLVRTFVAWRGYRFRGLAPPVGQRQY